MTKIIKLLKKNTLTILSLIMAFVMLFYASIGIVWAYFSRAADPDSAPLQFNVNQLFGRLDTTLSPSGEWGTAGNPYLIYENTHLENLYLLQNYKGVNAIDETRVFQVSNQYGNPCVVGNGLSIPSIGSEDYPFVSTLRGVVSQTNPATLPSGESSNTSVIYGVTIEAYEGQIDIGLFGEIGRPINDGNYYGLVENLLLANISIVSSSKGENKAEHSAYQTVSAHETNHIGILAGHAENCTIKNISVYYSSRTAAAAFDIASVSSAKYTTAGGILGYYHNVIISDDSPPVNSDAMGEGGINVGTGLGIMFSGDIWDILEQSNPSLSDNSYDINTSFDENLYGTSDETYFQIGVFTFVHSNQQDGKDRITKLWQSESDKDFSVSNNGSYTQSATQDFTAQKAECILLNRNNYQSYTSAANDYRFMIVVSDNNINYALMKSSRNAVTQMIDFYTENSRTYVNFPLKDGESSLFDYTFQVCRTRTAVAKPNDIDIDGFQRYTYGIGTGSDAGKLATASTTYSGGTSVYYCYGMTDIRPLRIYDTISFANSSSASSYPEYVRLVRASSWADDAFKLHRGNIVANWLHYTSAAGFSPYNATNYNNAATIQLYAVAISAATSVTNSRYVYTPSGSNYTTYDMSQNVLFYSGSYTSSSASEKYRYDIRSLEDLGWIKDDGTILTSVDTTLVMNDSTMYYYTNSTYFGTQTVPVGDAVNQQAPRGSVAFRVQSSPGVSTAAINIIVATDPMRLINQTINCSYFGTGSDRSAQLASSFVLPPVQGASATSARSIYVRDGTSGSYRTAYANFNTLLIAYTMTVTTGQTYFLEASSGSASFVYFSVASTASRDRNYKHKTDLAINALTGIDYVYKTGSTISTVGSTDYIHSLVMPYFGMKNNTAAGGTLISPVIEILSCYNLSYNIYRCDVVEDGPQIYIDATSTQGTTTKQIMTALNINFAGTSYLDLEQRQRVYSDEVIIYLNGTLLDWVAYYAS